MPIASHCRNLGLALALACLGACADCGSSAETCQSSDDCSADQVCIEASCRQTCNADGDCPITESCNNGACIPLSRQRDAATADSGASDIGASDIGASDIGASDIGASDIGASDIGASDIGASDIGASDIGASDIGSSDIGESDVGRSDIGASDIGASDIGSSDIGASDIGSSDAGASDTATTDAARADSAAPDAARPDAASAGPTTLTCNERYGAIPTYALCLERPDECEFYVEGTTPCSEHCSAFGGSCVITAGTSAGSCDPTELDSCESELSPKVCVCTRPGPACDQLFGHRPDYALCLEQEDSCEFYNSMNIESCDEVCVESGLTCLGNFDDEQNTCTHAGTRACDWVSGGDTICVCSR